MYTHTYGNTKTPIDVNGLKKFEKYVNGPKNVRTGENA